MAGNKNQSKAKTEKKNKEKLETVKKVLATSKEKENVKQKGIWDLFGTFDIVRN